MKYRYAVLGAGRQGLSAACDLDRFGDAEEVRLYDIDLQAAREGAARLNQLLDTDRVKAYPLDARNSQSIDEALQGIHSAVSAVPYPLNLSITEAAKRGWQIKTEMVEA